MKSFINWLAVITLKVALLAQGIHKMHEGDTVLAVILLTLFVLYIPKYYFFESIRVWAPSWRFRRTEDTKTAKETEADWAKFDEWLDDGEE